MSPPIHYSILSSSKLASSDYQTMPWKNGQGTTRQFIISPSTCTSVNDDFTFRLSSAQMKTQFHQQQPLEEQQTTTNSQKVPFSSFVGYSRVLIYTQCNLSQHPQQKTTHPTQMYIIQQHEEQDSSRKELIQRDYLPLMVPYYFSGSAKTECELIPSTIDEGDQEHLIIDYNVMTKDERTKCEKVVCRSVHDFDSSEEINLLQLLDLLPVTTTSSTTTEQDEEEQQIDTSNNQRKWHLFLYVPDDLDALVKVNIPKSSNHDDKSSIHILNRDDTLQLEGVGDYSQVMSQVKVTFEPFSNEQEKGGSHVIGVLIIEN
ncbi:predicted protein [Naegleria gruberi]|uniref:Predicted protein n=1 Tax=Naegleria gruberi TaxID=5762 RepID=D2VRV3_NAEGR|nr:uncharacterized protein NAEGRDRAFT_71715 [Naegleria gruberi]EFC40530.1 predicted protein [Naegleria gruberi]|eukprot:XP_002673274.1 predicted protein [Naegleria gruberi strain NEG-M]